VSEEGARLSAQWLYDAQLSEARRARTWRYTWTGVNGGLAVASFALIPFASKDQRLELWVGGVGSTLSTAMTLFWPLEVESTLGRNVKPGTPCERLRIEEQLAGTASDDEAGRVTLPWHIVNLGVGGIYTTIIGLGSGRWDSGVIDGLIAFGLGELQLFTQPTRFVDRYEAYGQRDRNVRAAFWVHPIDDRGGFALGVSGTF
jgi:hypothetical protein